MTTYSIPQAQVLGDSDLEGWPVAFSVLPDGEIFALNFVQDSHQPISASTIEFLQPESHSIVDVTSAAYTGAIPTDIDSITDLALLYVGSNSLPDILIPDYGLDDNTGVGAQMRVLAPDAEGRYANVTGALPQYFALNQNVTAGEIDGQAAFAVSDIGNPQGLPNDVELLIANPDGTFTNWTSHIPASVFMFPAGPGTYYNAAAIADFTGHGGDIFLGAGAGVPYNTLLVNNGSGYFTADTINVPKPTLTGEGTLVEFVLATKFYGDTHEDAIVVYSNADLNNTTGNNYYIQFLKGNGQGGFTDVTAAHMPVQPQLTSSFGTNGYVQSLAIVTINGLDDLIAYTANGAPEIFLNNGEGVYSVSPVQVPGLSQTSYASYDLSYTQWGEDDGVGGFYGYSSGNQWLFVPITNAYLSPFSPVLNQPLANKLYLYGNTPSAATATTLGQTFQTQISLTGDMFYQPGTASTVDVIVNGVDVGAEPFLQQYQGLNNGQAYTAFRTLTFDVPGIVDIKTLEITTNTPGLYLTDVSIDGVDLGTGANSVPTGDNMRDMTDVALWNTAIGSSSSLGTAADPIQVTATGSGVAAYVLGSENDYAIAGIGTAVIDLSEDAGLDQNAVLSNVAFIDFQDGTVLNTRTGAVTTSGAAPTEDFSQLEGYVTSAGGLSQLHTPSGAVLGEEQLSVSGGRTITQYLDATGDQYAATVVTVSSGQTTLQDFDGSWNQTDAAITIDQGGGSTLLEYFDGYWNRLGAVSTEVDGSRTIIQDFSGDFQQRSASVSTVDAADGSTIVQYFDSAWNQTSAVSTVSAGDTVRTQDFDGAWIQTSASVVTTHGGTVQTQDFDANWDQISASIVTHPNTSTTIVQGFDSAWNQVSASIVTVSGGATTETDYDGSWTLIGGTVTSALNAETDLIQTYDATWAHEALEDRLVVQVQPGLQVFDGGSGVATTYIFHPGDIAGDAFTDFVTAAQDSTAHDVLDFVGYGAGAALTQIDASHWRITAPGLATEVFTLSATLNLATDVRFG